MRRTLVAAIFTAAFGATSVAHAAETITFTYDAKGRVVKVERGGTVNGGVTADYTLDKADNRTRIKVINSPNSTPPP